jgi:HAD superfamily hydrolase (TIGR01509 family)
MNTYLFDFDGTLVNSMPAFVSVMKRILDEHNIPYGSDLVKIITPLGYAGTARYFRQLGLNRSEDELIALMNQYALPEYQYRIPAKDTVIDTLIQLKAQGADLNILTASPHSMLDPCLTRLGIFDLFNHVWSCDDFNTTKVDPNIYKMAADRIGKPVDQILFLDDNYNADKTAKAAGMAVCGVYDDSSAEYEAEIRGITDRYIYRFSELL